MLQIIVKKWWQILVGMGIISLLWSFYINPSINGYSVIAPISVSDIIDVVVSSLAGTRPATLIVGPIALNPTGTKFATLTSQGVEVYSLPQKELLNTFGAELVVREHRANPYLIAWSPDGDFIATSGVSLTVNIWQASSGKLLQTLDHSAKGYLMRSLTFCTNGKLLYISVYEGYTTVWQRNGDRFEDYATFDEEEPILSPKDNLVIFAQLPIVRKVLNGKFTPIQDLVVDWPIVNSIFSLDGKLLVAITGDGAYSWDTTTWIKTRIREFSRQNLDESEQIPWDCLVFSPDGRYIASAVKVNFMASEGQNDDQNIWIWRVSDGKVVKKLSGQNRYARNIIWHPDGKSILVAGGDNVIRIWPVDDLK